MKIVVCASINLTMLVKEVKDRLEKLGHEVEIPFMSQKIIAGEISLADFLQQKEESGDGIFRVRAGEDLIKRYYHSIERADAILVANGEKNGVKNYIGGNVFLEIGFAHILDKKIFLLNPLPEVSYKDELEAIKPVILNNNLNLIN